MNEFVEAIDWKVIQNLSNEQLDELLEVLKNV